MHFLGLAGMQRRVVDYPDALAGWNLVSSVGALISGIGALLFLFILARTLLAGGPVPANPWGVGATTLEWSLSSPPPAHSFAEPPDLGSQPAE